VLIGGRVRVEPYAVVQAGASLEPGTALGALRKAKSSIVRERKDPLAFMRAFGRGRAPSEDATAALKKCARAPPPVALRLRARSALQRTLLDRHADPVTL